MDAGPWNYLEIAKLATSVFTPGALALMGIYIHRTAKRFEQAQWQNQKLTEKRLAIYDDLAPQINDVLCYFTYVGSWREFVPPEIVGLKRQIDKKLHLAAPLFSTEFFDACVEFQNLCFETYTGWGRDARLRTNYQRRVESEPDGWKAEWRACFSNIASDPNAVRQAYQRVMNAFSKDLGVHTKYVIPEPRCVPGNIR